MTDGSSPAASAVRAMAGSALRHTLTAIGATLVAHRYVDQATADSAVGPIADYVLGAAIALGSTGWGAFRARASHWQWVQAWLAPARALPPA